jgi:hypothetical protein
MLEALGVLREAREAHSICLKELDGAVICFREVANKAEIAWRLYRISDLEAAEADASRALLEAEKTVLKTRPSTVAGCEALLGFLQSYLNDDPEIALAIDAIGYVAAALKTRLAP